MLSKQQLTKSQKPLISFTKSLSVLYNYSLGWMKFKVAQVRRKTLHADALSGKQCLRRPWAQVSVVVLRSYSLLLLLPKTVKLKKLKYWTCFFAWTTVSKIFSLNNMETQSPFLYKQWTTCFYFIFEWLKRSEVKN